MLRAVCFDLMGTLLYDPYVEAIRAATELELSELAGVRDPSCWPAFELGQITEDEFARRFFTVENRSFDLEAFNRVRNEGYRFLPGMAELVDELQGRVELHVASNYPVWIDELTVRFALDRRFDGVWASHHLGARKPDADFFARLLDKLGHPAEQLLFVDDRADNCGAAETAGFRVHAFVGAADLRARLAREGLFR